MTVPSIKPVYAILQKWAKESGVKEAPVRPTETNLLFPFSYAYLRSSDIYIDPGPAERDLVMVYLDIHFNRIDLPTDYDKMTDVYETLKPKFVASPTLEDTVSTINAEAPLRVEFGKLQLGNVETLGLRWHISIKIKE